MFIQSFPFLADRTPCLPQQQQWWLCCSGTGDLHVNFGNYWCLKAKGIWCINETLSQESKVWYKLINQDSCVTIFSNAFLYLRVHLGKKTKTLRNRRIQLQVLKDIFSLVFDRDIANAAKNNQRWEWIRVSLGGGCSRPEGSWMPVWAGCRVCSQWLISFCSWVCLGAGRKPSTFGWTLFLVFHGSIAAIAEVTVGHCFVMCQGTGMGWEQPLLPRDPKHVVLARSWPDCWSMFWNDFWTLRKKTFLLQVSSSRGRSHWAVGAGPSLQAQGGRWKTLSNFPASQFHSQLGIDKVKRAVIEIKKMQESRELHITSAILRSDHAPFEISWGCSTNSVCRLPQNVLISFPGSLLSCSKAVGRCSTWGRLAAVGMDLQQSFGAKPARSKSSKAWEQLPRDSELWIDTWKYG